MTEKIDRLVDMLAEDAAKVKSAAHPFMLSLRWIGAGGLYLALSLGISGLRPDLDHALRQPWFAAEIAALLAVFAATSLSAALLAFPDMHQKRSLALSPLWMFALFLLVMVFSWIADNPPAPLPVHSYQCTLCISLLSLPPAAWTFHILRRYASTHYNWAGINAVLSAFSLGALWLRLYEVNDSIVHVMIWHYLPMLAAGLAGLFLGRALLKW